MDLIIIFANLSSIPLPLALAHFIPFIFIFEHFDSSGSHHPFHRTEHSNPVAPWILRLTRSHTLRSRFLAIPSFLPLLTVTMMTEEGLQGC